MTKPPRAEKENKSSTVSTIENKGKKGDEKAAARSERPDARPDWINAPPRLVGNVYQMSVVVGPYSTRQECDAQLPAALQEALDRYVETCLGRRPAERIAMPSDELRRRIVVDQWEDVRQYSVGPMTQLHVLLQFDRKMKGRVLEECRQAVVAGRLWYAGAGSAAVLLLLTVAYGYLKMRR